MAWFRLPRSFRTYLIVALIVSIAILTFSTSKMIRVDASDPRPTFPFLFTNDKQHSGTTTPAIDSLKLRSLPASLHEEESRKLDFHSTIAGHSLSNTHDINLKPELPSDAIIISPQQSTTLLNKAVDISELNHNETSKHAHRNVKAHTFPSFNSTSPEQRYNVSKLSDSDSEQKRNFIRDMMRHAWRGYATYAWGYNELRPVSKGPHLDSIFGAEKLGASIIDGIDTLYIMGLNDEYLEARSWIENNLDFNNDVDLSVFETNIRYVGGLLSIYSLTKDPMFLEKARIVADKLLPAFDSPTGIPYSNVNLRTGYARNHGWAYNAAILSEFGSMHLEFVYLSHLTGDPKYKEKAYRIRDVIRRAVPRSDGLYNNYMSTETGQWLTRPTHISMGALGDSFYEYLIKSFVQTDGQDVEAYDLYVNAIKAFENKLIFTSTQSRLVYVAELKDLSITHKMDSLACFAGGMLALGSVKSEEPVKSRHMNLAKGIAETCHESSIRAQSHLSPESFVFSNRVEAVAYGLSDKYFILRPEILETYFYMWRYTHDPKYRAWAWDFAESLERYCKAEAGYSGLRNVYQPVIKDDVQQSFFLAEVLKYLYLIFSDDSIVSLDDWVFNTEAHIFPIMKQN